MKRKPCQCNWCKVYRPVALRVRRALKKPLRDEYDAMIYHMTQELRALKDALHGDGELEKN